MTQPTDQNRDPSARARASVEEKFDAGEWVTAPAVRTGGRLPWLAALVGVMVGTLGVLFFAGSELIRAAVLGSAGNLSTTEAETGGWFATAHAMLPEPDPTNPRVWMLALIPAAGGFLLGLWRRATHDVTATGNDAAIHAFHHDRGRFQPGMVWRKFVASTLTLGSGGAAGREGPIALMGAGIGSSVATRFGLTLRERRILLVAGMAAGIGGMFRAPLAGGLLAAELLYSDTEFEPDVLIPSTIASIISYCVFCLNFGWGSLFPTVAADYQFANPLELIPLTLLGVALSLAALLFVLLSRAAARVFKRLPALISPAVGAGLAGIVAIGLYLISGLVSADGEPQQLLFAVMGDGYAALSVATGGMGVWWLLLLIAGGKALASALTVGSGGAGGYFAPSMVIGGCLGAGVGLLAYQALPAGVLPTGMFPTDEAGRAAVTAVFALVGMAGFWTSVSKGPVGSVIIVSELTGSYHLLLPAMWTCAITFLLSRKFKLFESQVPTRLDSPAHMGDFAADVLREIRVQQILDDIKDFETVDEGTPIRKILSLKGSRQHYYPVVDRDGKFIGIFSLNDLRAVLDDAGVWQLLVARDVAHTQLKTVHPGETLADVAAKFAETSLEELPVVGEKDPSKLLGMISRRQLNNAYIKRVMLYDRAAKAEQARATHSRRMPRVEDNQ